MATREPGADQAPALSNVGGSPFTRGKTIHGTAQAPANLPGEWPQWRGADRSGIASNLPPLARSWADHPPRMLWTIDVGEGYAGAAVREGRVYLMDYDRDAKQSALRCLSLADGQELWRFAYPLSIKRNHGMTRTVPAISDSAVVAMDSKCNVVCVDATNGEFRWGIDLTADFGATVPQWYAGQCPLIDNGAVILAPGGDNALLIAVDLGNGKPLWKSPNPRQWKMTHSSVTPMEFGGQRMYVYCGSGGVAGVSATNGTLLWDTDAWKVSLATVLSPLPLPGGRVFLSGGYNSGAVMLQLTETGGRISAAVQYRLAADVFGATQHTPILYDNHIYGVRPSGAFVCLNLDGKPLWASPVGQDFGLGPFLLGDGLFLALNDSGKLTLIEAGAARFNKLGEIQALKGDESWGPMALAGGRLLLRDLTHLACFDIAASPQ